MPPEILNIQANITDEEAHLLDLMRAHRKAKAAYYAAVEAQRTAEQESESRYQVYADLRNELDDARDTYDREAS